MDGERLLHSPEETHALGQRIGRGLRGGELISLTGELGTGKTQLAKGIAWGLDVPDALRLVTSPTYVLHCQYQGRLLMHHSDVYRLTSPESFLELGLFELLDAQSVLLIEWADRVRDVLPTPDLELQLEHAGENSRRISWRGAAPGSLE